MKAVIQRVLKANVSVLDEVVSSIDQGLCVLVGISRDDTDKDIEYIVRKILNIRLFDDPQQVSDAAAAASNAKWSKCVVERNLEVLCVSQFTLQAVLKGNRPDFHLAMGADESKSMYEKFLAKMTQAYKSDKIKDGRFGAYMQVSLQNDGPVTILLDSKKEPKTNE